MKIEKHNTGFIFKNKVENPDPEKNYPHYTGEILVDGKPYRIALWMNKSKSTDTKYFSVKLSEPGSDSEPVSEEELPF